MRTKSKTMTTAHLKHGRSMLVRVGDLERLKAYLLECVRFLSGPPPDRPKGRKCAQWALLELKVLMGLTPPKHLELAGLRPRSCWRILDLLREDNCENKVIECQQDESGKIS